MPDTFYYNHRDGAELVCKALTRAMERLRNELSTYELLSPLTEDPEGVREVDKLLNKKTKNVEKQVEKARDHGNLYVAHVAKRLSELHELKQMFELDTAPDTASVQKARMVIHNCMLYEAVQAMDSYENKDASPNDPNVVWVGQSMLLYAQAMNAAFADFPGDTWNLYPLDHPTRTA